MSQASKTTYQADLILQGIAYFPMVISYILFIFSPGFAILGMLAQFGLGFVQVISAAFHTLRYQEEAHKKYFLGSLGYVFFLFFAVAWINIVGIFIYLFLFIIPILMSTWYYWLTWVSYKNASNRIPFDSKGRFDNEDDILDDVMMK